MTGTHTSLRTPPPRVFENYVLTRLVDTSAGLTQLPQSSFVQVTGPTTFTSVDSFIGAGAGGTDDTLSLITPIGFDFEIDGVTYNSWIANTNGWMALVDSTVGWFLFTEILSGSSDRFNARIRPTFTSQAVMLAPWFDDLKNVFNEPSQLQSSPFLYSNTKTSRITSGLEPTPIFLNSTSYGISYCNDDRSPAGRRLVVRWSSISNYILPSSALRFEVVIYENGTIEYRYAPRVNITQASAAVEGATVGIFMPNGTNRFRDFSAGLGYRENSRQENVYGGFVYDASYSDTDNGETAPYTVALQPYYNWPGLRSSGCVLSFTPPMLRRRVLPKAFNVLRDSKQVYPLVARTGDTRLGTALAGFDDRLSPNYTSGSSIVVNYPSTLPRFFGGNGLGVTQRQNVFAGDFLVAGNIVKSAIDQYVDERPNASVEPFSDNQRPEQDGASDLFFASGSTGGHVVNGFDRGLRSKTHVRFALPINTKVSMPGASSSIYYYNSRTKAWQVPSNSTYILGNTSTTPPTNGLYAGGDWANPSRDAATGRIIEDARGFGPVGNIVSSGSLTPAASGQQTDTAIGSQYGSSDLATVIGKSYDKSVRSNGQYRAAAEECFTLPINAPFLVEKAVFELPLQAGPGWFNDMTQCSVPLVNSRSFDFGGPGITVALWRQAQMGYGAVSVRDLILTGTITHVYDHTASVVMSNFVPSSSTFLVRPVGFLSYAGEPGAVIDDSGRSQFTGTVSVKAAALSTAGMGIVYRRAFDSSNGASNASACAQLLQQSPTLFLTSSSGFPTLTTQVGYVSPVGRGGTGLRQSGRSALGNEHVTWQGMSDQAALVVKNPLYVGPNGLNAQQVAALSSSTFAATASTVLQLGSYFPSPYLVMPGDRLVVSVSKTRPAFYGGSTWFSGSTHDVVLAPGNLNITLYGSQVLEGTEFHDCSNQALGSDCAHEMIGAEPVVDQFELAYYEEHSGSFTDDCMIGTMGTQTVLSYSGGSPIQWVRVQSTRDRRASKVNARSAAVLGTSAADLEISAFKSARLTQWWELTGDIRLTQFTDSSERYWDSMMPSVKDCFAADGCGVFITPPGTFGGTRQIDTGPSGSIMFEPWSTKMGWIWMDYGVPALFEAGYGPLINVNWNKAFPFEPRYSRASRQVNVERSLIATYLYGGSPVVQRIRPTQVNGFGFGTTHLNNAYFYGGTTTIVESVCWDWFVDVSLTSTNVFGYYVTSSMGVADISRLLFGFGDRNTMYSYDGSGGTAILGSNHVAESRDVEGPHPDPSSVTHFDNNYFRVSPKIRGWKYGVISGLPTYSKAYWRRNKFGQFRDMLEQRPYSKYHRTSDTTIGAFGRGGVQPGVVKVTFVDPASGRLTAPENTWSSNLSQECTSSFPFFDGSSTNRPTINPLVLNLHPNVINNDGMGNISIA